MGENIKKGKNRHRMKKGWNFTEKLWIIEERISEGIYNYKYKLWIKQMRLLLTL